MISGTVPGWPNMNIATKMEEYDYGFFTAVDEEADDLCY